MFSNSASPVDLASSVVLIFLKSTYRILTIYPINIGILLLAIIFIVIESLRRCFITNEKVRHLQKNRDAVDSKKTK
jgi:uncharacterized membrane protein (DUF106 family)